MKGSKCFLRWRGFAVAFHPLFNRKVYSLVPAGDATRFPDEESALDRAAEHHLTPVEIEWDGDLTTKKESKA